MGEPKWTKGPWVWRPAYLNAGQDEADTLAGTVGDTEGDGMCVAAIHHDAGLPAVANANLIAAAPELYEALEELVRVQMDGDWEYWRGARDRAEAALAKARGEG